MKPDATSLALLALGILVGLALHTVLGRLCLWLVFSGLIGGIVAYVLVVAAIAGGVALAFLAQEHGRVGLPTAWAVAPLAGALLLVPWWAVGWPAVELGAAAPEARLLTRAVERYAEREGRCPERLEDLTPAVMMKLPRARVGPDDQGSFLLVPSEEEPCGRIGVDYVLGQTCVYTPTGWLCAM